ncbi:hypothetical protein [Sphingomonas yantingensis]|jgi:hypothetical protein|uniref:Glucose-methanol-choline oxidoreductase C-terminal domain-containing protein n=1 Tax=Sphingomonas yantingensis TaxID=1241761 RepID=A0A7W9ASC0_9SPHN|nr:hypothetical protein [Sphingomonas yantingensis]MBB5699685.1 hypothetical protein [Sphingomonas yantingensis]
MRSQTGHSFIALKRGDRHRLDIRMSTMGRWAGKRPTRLRALDSAKLPFGQPTARVLLRSGLVDHSRQRCARHDRVRRIWRRAHGSRSETSKLNGFNQAHDAYILYATDGAMAASASCVNPSLTFMAIAARPVGHAVGQMKAGAI